MSGSGNSVRSDGKHVFIRMTKDEAFALRIALEECPCKAAKSKSTMSIRARLNKALGRAVAKPTIHGENSCPYCQQKSAA